MRPSRERKPRQEKLKQWIKINGETLYGEIRDPSVAQYYLLPWNPKLGLNQTSIRRQLLSQRPQIKGHKSTRRMKDLTYLTVRSQIVRHKVQGAYIGLAAAHAPEIFALLNQQIESRFVNCQIHRKDYKALLEYQPFIAEAYPYPRYSVDFELYRTDILNYLLTERGQFSIYDLDFMCTLTEELIDRIFAGVIYSVKLPATVAIWHTAGRAVTNEDLEQTLRPLIASRFRSVFDVKEHIRVDYYEGFPMRCDIITLEQKGHARRRSTA